MEGNHMNISLDTAKKHLLSWPAFIHGIDLTNGIKAVSLISL